MKNLPKIAVWIIGISLLLWAVLDLLWLVNKKSGVSEQEIHKHFDRLPWLFMGGIAVLVFGNLVIDISKK